MGSTQKVALVLTGMVTAVVCFVTGLLIGWFLTEIPLPAGSRTTSRSNDTTSSLHSSGATYDDVATRKACAGECHLQEDDPSITARLLQQLQASSIERHIRFLSERPHLAGTRGDQRTVDYIKQEFQSMGYNVTLYPYDVVLSYPAQDHFNKVSVLDGRGRAIITSGIGAKTGSDWDSEVFRPYCMYSPSGRVQGKLVYANYGRPQDFKVLEKMGVDTRGAVIIMRYAKQTRARMVREAAKRGSVGVILYNDPADVNMNVTQNVYPATWWLPADDVEHGNTRTQWGDPATPGYASTEGAHRLGEKQMELPEIPCQPVSYTDAKLLLQILNGPSAPEDWQGQLGLQYGVVEKTPGEMPVELSVKNVLDTRRIYNIVATLTGSQEPDRVVLMGNHHDATAYGGVDPGSGTAVMLEVANAFAQLAAQGWRPRRTVMFCSWAAKEFGLIGSTEWVEEKRRWLSNHVVSYLNLDSVLQGNYTFDMSATPSLQAAAIAAASKVPDPYVSGWSVLDAWKDRVANERRPGHPWIRRPICDTDMMPFMHMIGVPVTHSRYSFVMEDGILVYPHRHFPLYHTVYDTAKLATMMDPHFAVCKAVAAVMTELTRDLANSLAIPISARDYAMELMAHLEKPMEKAKDKFNSSVVYLQSALDTFLLAATDIQSKIASAHSLNAFEIRQLNDKLVLFEREFVDITAGTHIFLSHGSNSNPVLDQHMMTKMTQALEAAAASLMA